MPFLLPRHQSSAPYSPLTPSAEGEEDGYFLPLPSPTPSSHRPSSSLSSSHTPSRPSLPSYSSSFPPSSPSLLPPTPLQAFFATHAPPPPTTKRGRTRWFFAAVLLALLSGLLYSAGQETVGVSVEAVKQGLGKVGEWGGGAWEAVSGASREGVAEEEEEETDEGEAPTELLLDEATSKEEQLLVEAEKEPVKEPPRKQRPPSRIHVNPIAPVEEEVDTSGPTIPIDTFPRPRRPPPDSTTKYIGFLPHSGFHNQRSALQNAFLLGAYLNRTVCVSFSLHFGTWTDSTRSRRLVPPVWIGWPTQTLFYDELVRSFSPPFLCVPLTPPQQQAWTDMVVMNPSSFGLPPHRSSDPLYLPAHYPSAVPAANFNTSTLPFSPATNRTQHWHDLGWKVRPDGYPITNLTAADCKSYSVECRHTYKDTFLAWDFLADLDKVGELVGVVDRWDIRERAIEGLLNVTKDDIVRSTLLFAGDSADTPLAGRLPR